MVPQELALRQVLVDPYPGAIQVTSAERNAAADKVLWLLTAFWSEHKAGCKSVACPTKPQMEEALDALKTLRKSR